MITRCWLVDAHPRFSSQRKYFSQGFPSTENTSSSPPNTCRITINLVFWLVTLHIVFFFSFLVVFKQFFSLQFSYIFLIIFALSPQNTGRENHFPHITISPTFFCLIPFDHFTFGGNVFSSFFGMCFMLFTFLATSFSQRITINQAFFCLSTLDHLTYDIFLGGNVFLISLKNKFFCLITLHHSTSLLVAILFSYFWNITCHIIGTKSFSWRITINL